MKNNDKILIERIFYLIKFAASSILDMEEIKYSILLFINDFNYESLFIKKFGSILYLSRNFEYHFSRVFKGTTSNCLFWS